MKGKAMMKPSVKHALPGLALLLAGLTAMPAQASVTGMWRVTGTISGKNFALDCKFQPNGTALGGECAKAPGNGQGAGKPSAFTTGKISGSAISWSYQAHYMFKTFSMNYTGQLNGNQIQGTVEAAGRQGQFTAVRE